MGIELHGQAPVGVDRGEPGWDGSIVGDILFARLPDLDDTVNRGVWRQNIEADGRFLDHLTPDLQGCPV